VLGCCARPECTIVGRLPVMLSGVSSSLKTASASASICYDWNKCRTKRTSDLGVSSVASEATGVVGPSLSVAKVELRVCEVSAAFRPLVQCGQRTVVCLNLIEVVF